MSECLSMPGIKRVWFLEAAYLPSDVVYRSVAGIPVSFSVQPTEIHLKGEAACEVEEQTDNNSLMEKSRLTFNTLTRLPTHGHLAFVFQTNDGDCFLIGSLERPHPTVKVNRSTGQPDGDASVRRYEVSFTAKKALAPCSV